MIRVHRTHLRVKSDLLLILVVNVPRLLTTKRHSVQAGASTHLRSQVSPIMTPAVVTSTLLMTWPPFM